MFEFLDGALDLVEDVVEASLDKVEKVIDDPIGETVKAVTQPLVDAVDIVEGLTEGELREKAILRLGADVVAGMGTSELIEWHQASQD